MTTIPVISHHTAADLPAADYDAWIAGRAGELIYARPMFHRFLAEAVGGTARYLLASRAGQLCGALCYFERVADKFGAVLNSLPWYGTHGGCVGVAQGDEATRRALLAAYRERATRVDVLAATMILSPDEAQLASQYADALGAHVTDARIGQWTALPAGDGALDALPRVVTQKTRNVVNKSLKQGFSEFVSDDDEAWDFLHRVHRLNLEAIGGKAKPASHFDALRRQIPAAHRRLSLAMLGHEPVAALLLLASQCTVEYLAPVISAEHRSRQPLSFLIWHGMRWAIERGYTWWNWGGTWHTQTSLLHFKAGWGAIERPYVYFIAAQEKVVHTLRHEHDAIAEAFPYYYVYPNHLL